MVSLCLTKPRIDGRISVVSEHAEDIQRQQARSDRTTLPGNNNVTDDRSSQNTANKSIESSEDVYIVDKQGLSLLSQASCGSSGTGADQSLKKQQTVFTYNQAQTLEQKKSKNSQNSSVRSRNPSFDASEAFATEKRNNMLASIKAMGGPPNRRASVYKNKKNVHYYNEHLVDARKDKYRVHKWRLKSGKVIQSNASLMSSNVMKFQQKMKRRDENTQNVHHYSKAYLPELMRNVESRYLPKTDPANSLKIALEGKERMFGIQKSEKLDMNKQLETKDRPFLARLRHHVKVANQTVTMQENSQNAHDRIPSSLFSSPETVIKSRIGNFNDNMESPEFEHPKRISDSKLFISGQSRAKLPQIDSERRRQSYPTRQKQNVKDYKASNEHAKRSFSLLPGIGATTSIPEDEPIVLRGTFPNQRKSSDKFQTIQESITFDQKIYKNAEPTLGGSPTNKKTYSSMSSIGGTTRSSSKEGKEGDTPTDSEGSLGASWHKRKLRRGSRMLAKMDSRNSPQAFRYIKPARILRLSETTRRILSLPTEKRTEKDVNLVQTALRNIKAISAYSNAVQKQIGRQGYFVGFEGKRVVVREGKKPFNYYLLLAGSAVVMKSDESGNTNPVLFMKRGDVFGENEILENTNWQWSVASSGYCEFLLLERDTYQNIFITGGGGGLLSDPDRGGFLRSISLLQQWPIETLNENPNRCLFRYFKRGALLATENTKSEWIYVVKSGSCSVLKKLMVEKLSNDEIMKKTRKEQEFVSDITAKPHLVEKSEAIQEEDHISLLTQKEEAEQHKDVGVLQQLEMSSILKELNPDVVGNSVSPRAEAGFDDFRSEIPLSLYKADGPVKERPASESEDPTTSSDNDSKYVREDTYGNFRMSRHSDRHPPRTPSPTKAAYLRTGVNSRQTGRESDEDIKQDHKNDMPPAIVITDTSDFRKIERSPLISPQKQVHIAEYLFGVNTPAEETKKEKEVLHPVHINVRRLTKRDTFGIGPHLYTNQPSLALVSNGAECLMLNKKFYLENASEECMQWLRETEYPYPSDEELIEQHWRLQSWNAYQSKTIKEIMKKTSLI